MMPNEVNVNRNVIDAAARSGTEGAAWRAA
jgi:hypothetical protein